MNTNPNSPNNPEVRFGSHYILKRPTRPAKVIKLLYCHHGVELPIDKEGRVMTKVFKIAARYGSPSSGEPWDRMLFESELFPGYPIRIYERAGRTYFEISFGAKTYVLDATEPDGPLEKFINALRREFPDNTVD